MFGVPLNGRANVFRGNQNVTNATSIGAHALQKKHNAIYCHRVREVSAMKMIKVGHIS